MSLLVLHIDAEKALAKAIHFLRVVGVQVLTRVVFHLSSISASILAVLFFCWTFTATRQAAKIEQHSASPYEVLSSIFVPTAHAHPKQYELLFRHFLVNNAIAINFVDLWTQISYGELELKDKMVLEELCLNEVRVFGRTISLDFDWSWKLRVIWNLLLEYLAMPRLSRIGSASNKGEISIPNIGTQSPFEGWATIPSSDNLPLNLGACLVGDTLDLDFIPLPFIPSAIILAHRQVVQEGTFEVEFTCLADSTGFASLHFWLCAAILLPNRHNISTSKKTGLPFIVDLPTILRSLSSPTVTVQSVKDISRVHAKALECHESDMVNDKWMRSSFVARHGIHAWRETRLRLKWEAMLLRASLLLRWKVTMVNAKQE